MSQLKDIRQIVAYYKRKYGTNNPFAIADCLGILYQVGNMECDGCYMFLKNHRYIFLSQNLSEAEMMLVMAHELGHAILHRKDNCYFIRNKTLFLNSKKEVQANKFAAELLISDEFLQENKEFTVEQVSRMLGYDQKLLELRLN